MPIRFVCHHCGQKLTVGRRRGGTKADCPKCHQTIRVPDDPTPGVSTMTASVIVMEGQVTAIESPQYDPELAAGGDEDFAIEPADFTFEIGSDTSLSSTQIGSQTSIHDSHHEHHPHHDDADIISLPRRVLYVQAFLLAAVAVICFTLGALMGGAFFRASEVANSEPATVTGTVNVKEGKKLYPEEGAAVFFLPQDSRNIDELIPIDGLRPSDAMPEENHRGLLMLRQIGGYARTDQDGNYRITVPRPGKYYLLVISRGKTLKGTDLTGKKEQIAKFFESATELLQKQKYHFSGESLANDRKFDVSFE